MTSCKPAATKSTSKGEQIMKKNIIATANAPAAIGPYSQAID